MNRLRDVIRSTRARTKREAVVAAITDFNRRRRLAELVKHAGTCDDLITVEELQSQRGRLREPMYSLRPPMSRLILPAPGIAL